MPALHHRGAVRQLVGPATRRACRASALPAHGLAKAATAGLPGVDHLLLLLTSRKAPPACRARNRRWHRPGCGPVAIGHDSVVLVDRHGAPTTPGGSTHTPVQAVAVELPGPARPGVRLSMDPRLQAHR